jgi:hypothetical protein
MTNYHLIPKSDYGYRVLKSGAKKASKVCEFFDDAMNYVRKRHAQTIYIHNHTGRIEARVDGVRLQGQIDSLTPRLTGWLKGEGEDFFNELIEEYGHIPLVFQSEDFMSPPHPVHLREGMQVRNWLRHQPECVDWDLGVVDMYDYIYMEMIYRALGKPIRSPIDGKLVDVD